MTTVMTKAEARDFGNRIHNNFLAARAERIEMENEMMARQGYSPQEIANVRKANEINEQIAAGHGEQHRTYKPQPCGWC